MVTLAQLRHESERKATLKKIKQRVATKAGEGEK